MKIREINKENILEIENDLELVDDDEKSNWIESMIEEFTENFFTFEPIMLCSNESIRIYRMNEHNYFYVTDSKDNVLKFFEVYDFSVSYETKYEYVFVGHEMNCHVDKLKGELNEFETR